MTENGVGRYEALSHDACREMWGCAGGAVEVDWACVAEGPLNGAESW